MKYQVAIYCPDQHLQYNLHTLNETGVGGGVTARIRMIHALAAAGHQVTAYVNCPKDEIIDGVRYIHFSRAKKLQADIFIASSSGGTLDLSMLCEKKISSRLRILMVHGAKLPSGVECIDFDYLYALSNFVRSLTIEKWGTERFDVFVSYRGVVTDFYSNNDSDLSNRDPFSMAYCGYPGKGLQAALEVLRIVRQKDERFSLHSYGGYQLWGENENQMPNEPRFFNHGLVGQSFLAQQMQKHGYSINLQEIREGFGLAVNESMRAGCIVLASAVGAYTEIIQDGRNGFLIEGPHTEPAVHQRAAALILELIEQPQRMQVIRRNAMAFPMDWSVIAQAWEGHWDWALNGAQSPTADAGLGACPSCGGAWLKLADGLHCTTCGWYSRALGE